MREATRQINRDVRAIISRFGSDHFGRITREYSSEFHTHSGVSVITFRVIFIFKSDCGDIHFYTTVDGRAECSIDYWYNSLYETESHSGGEYEYRDRKIYFNDGIVFHLGYLSDDFPSGA